mgnify:FL=1|tara:strand:- start:670 stop:849 length:180 start_codon:yes stop_codon:yes gene_type:complete
MSHPINTIILEEIEDKVNAMPCLDLLNYCDEVGIKTTNVPMEVLMDLVIEHLTEKRMQP